MELLAQRNYCGAIVGSEGAGKSTLLEDLRPKLIERGFEPVSLRLTQEAPRFSRGVLREMTENLRNCHVVLLDGAEQLSWWAWAGFRWRVRRAGGLIITAHRSGLLPTVITCRTNAELLSQIVGRLLGEEQMIPREEIEQLLQRHHGNIREALRELYDTFSAKPSDDLNVGPAC